MFDDTESLSVPLSCVWRRMNRKIAPWLAIIAFVKIIDVIVSNAKKINRALVDYNKIILLYYSWLNKYLQ